ncbi:MAG: 3-deoxy-7-phosphoheptulonate synthase [Oscillospiraceae bacterium]|nr:3-deoxy-7-phosphoheptulonate synthase [Oscillospiraceae bacterium]MDD4546584.1 3-deoxy-7-phosphoheptulonate synthase [Oscillospiraceae bacterium]
MIVILKQNTENARIEMLINKIEKMGLSCHYSAGAHTTILGIIGDTSTVDINLLRANEIVEDVKRVSEPYKAVNRKFQPEDTIVRIPGSEGKEVCIGGDFFCVIAGPCSVESEEQIVSIAKDVKKSGATLLRGGAFKPRTSPYAFQGLHSQGLELLLTAKQETGLPIVSEIMDLSHLDLFRDVDVIQVGARNMQNFSMLKALGHCGKPVLLKRGLANTIEEFLMSAEYIMAGGNSQVILCERGIRTFETFTRNTLDISAVPVLNHLSHLPVMVDPSHAAGLPWLINPLSKASVAAGADGLMIEVHNNPSAALSDGAQSLTPAQFNSTMDVIKSQVLFEGKQI